MAIKKFIPLILFAIISAIILFIFSAKNIEIPESSEVVLIYNYTDTEIYINIYDKNEIMELKTLLSGNVIKDNPSCGFSENISITFIGDKNLMLCPALDGCEKIRIDTTNKYISISKDNRKKLDAFLSKYGFKFPSV
jgi:hypothetical protein